MKSFFSFLVVLLALAGQAFGVATPGADAPKDAYSGLSSLGFDYFDQQLEGLTRATIGDGTITVLDQDPDGAVAALNRDTGSVQIITRDKTIDISLDIPVQQLIQFDKNIQRTVNLARALTAVVPEDVRAMGPRGAELFRKLIANGATLDQAYAATQTEDFRQLAIAYRNADLLAEAYGGIENVPAGYLQTLAFAEGGITQSAVDGKFYVTIPCPTASGACQIELDNLQSLIEANPNVVEALITNAVASLEAPGSMSLLVLNKAFFDAMLCLENVGGEYRAQEINRLYGANPSLFRASLGHSGYASRFDPHGLIDAIEIYQSSGSYEELDSVISAYDELRDAFSAEAMDQLERVGYGVGFAAMLALPLDEAALASYGIFKAGEGLFRVGGVVVRVTVENGKAVLKKANDGAEWVYDKVRRVWKKPNDKIESSNDNVDTVFTRMNKGGGLAIRKLLGEKGLIEDTESLAEKVEKIQQLTSSVLTSPDHKFSWKIGSANAQGFIGNVNGKATVLMVAKDGPYKGKLFSAWVPNKTQLKQFLSFK